MPSKGRRGRNPLPPKGQISKQALPSSIQQDVSIVRTEGQYQSVYPLPAVIDALERNHPGATEKVLEIVKAEMEHHHYIQRKDIELFYDLKKAEQRDDAGTVRRGQLSSTTIVLTCIASFTVLAALGLPLWGLAIFLIGISGVIGITLYGKYQSIKIAKDSIQASEAKSDESTESKLPG